MHGRAYWLCVPRFKNSSIERGQGRLKIWQTDLYSGRRYERHNRAKYSLFG